MGTGRGISAFRQGHASARPCRVADISVLLEFDAVHTYHPGHDVTRDFKVNFVIFIWIIWIFGVRIILWVIGVAEIGDFIYVKLVNIVANSCELHGSH